MIARYSKEQSRGHPLPRLIIVIVILLGFGAGCDGDGPPSPTPIPIPAISTPTVGTSPLKPGDETGISVSVSTAAGVDLKYTWNVEGGVIVKGQGSPAITYRAPNEPGIYKVEIVVQWDGQSVQQFTFIEVEMEEEPPLTPSLPLTPTLSTVPTITPPPTPFPPITWIHNPDLPAPAGYPGDLGYTQQNYPGTSFVRDIPIPVTGDQILIVHGYAALLPEYPDIGVIGGSSHCFLLMTRGPFSSTIDLKTAAVEVHDADLEAITLVWAAQKVEDMKKDFPTCMQEMDIWIGQ